MSITPRSGSKRTTFEELMDDPIAFFGLLFLAMMALPAVIPGVRDTVVTWLLEHHLVVPAAAASLTIPLTIVGLDGRRIVVAALALVVIVSLLVWNRARRRRLHAGGQP